MGKVLGIVYRTIATHLIKKAGFTRKTAHSGAVTLIQCFGGALNLNVHLMCMDARMPRAQGCAGAAHMLFLDGAYVDDANGSVARFQWVKAPTSEELTRLTHQIALRIGRFLERRGVLVRDAEDSYLTSDTVDEDPMQSLVGHSISSATAPALLYLLHPCRRTVLRWGHTQGARCSPKAPTVGRLQTSPACDEPAAGKVAGFSPLQGTLSPRPGSHLVHAGVAAKADEHKKLERLCRYIARAAVAEKRLSLTSQGQVRYDVKGFTSVAGAWMRKSD